MKIQIKKCSGENYWYKNRIGEIYEVLSDPDVPWYRDKYCDEHYYVGDDKYVSKEDAIDYSKLLKIKEILK